MYILDRDQECNKCYLEKHPVELQRVKEAGDSFKKSIKDYNAAQAKKRREKKVKHPCKSRMVSGRCQLSMVNGACQYSPRKAVKLCGDFEYKKGMVKA